MRGMGLPFVLEKLRISLEPCTQDCEPAILQMLAEVSLSVKRSTPLFSESMVISGIRITCSRLT